MKKGKILITVTIGIMCMMLTTVIFIQFKTINQTDVTSLDNMREEDLRKEVTSVKTKYEEAGKRMQEIDNMIAEYQETIDSGIEASDTLARELKESNDLLGKNDVTGARSNNNATRWK